MLVQDLSQLSPTCETLGRSVTVCLSLTETKIALSLHPCWQTCLSVLVTTSVAQSPSCLVSPHLSRRARHGCRITNTKRVQGCFPRQECKKTFLISETFHISDAAVPLGFEFLCTGIATSTFLCVCLFSSPAAAGLNYGDTLFLSRYHFCFFSLT